MLIKSQKPLETFISKTRFEWMCRLLYQKQICWKSFIVRRKTIYDMKFDNKSELKVWKIDSYIIKLQSGVTTLFTYPKNIEYVQEIP